MGDDKVFHVMYAFLVWGSGDSDLLVRCNL